MFPKYLTTVTVVQGCQGREEPLETQDYIKVTIISILDDRILEYSTIHYKIIEN